MRPPVGRASRPTPRFSNLSGINPDLQGNAGRAFTLLEVVIAIGIFALGMVAVIGLFSPAAKSVGDSADAEAATRVADLLNVKLQSMGYDAVAKLLKVQTSATAHELTAADAKTNYNVATDSQLLFASRDGTKIGKYADGTATWPNGDRDKFFEIALIRNETISPVAADSATPPPLVLPYVVRVRWPAFVALAGGTGVAQPAQSAPGAAVAFDHSQKQVLFFTGAVTR